MDSSSAPHDLSRRMAELARGFYRPRDLDETLWEVTAAAIDLVPAANCADILIVTGRKKFRSVAPTSALPSQLDALQERLGEGPCVDASYKNLVVRSDDMRVEDRWPKFAQEAQAAGVLSTLSFQLYLDDDAMGALNLFAFEAEAFDPEAEAITEVLAAHAAMALNAARSHRQFTSALASRDMIGQAKGMIMERFAIDAVAAFELLRTLSQDSNIPLATVSERIVDAGHGLRHTDEPN